MPRRADPNLVDSTSVTIRFPKEIYQWIKSRSDKEKRSFNAQVLLEFERLIEQQSGGVTISAPGTVSKPSE